MQLIVRNRPLALVVLALAPLAIGCGDDDDGAASLEPQTEAADTATAPAKFDGKFDVGGHKLYLKCRGSAPPTVIYMHGSITEANVVPHENGALYLSSLGDEHRVCVFDRRNLGNSDTVDAPSSRRTR